MACLSIRGVTRRPWFEDLSLDLNAGDIVVLTGPSGSGKTLLLRALADLDAFDSGTVELDGCGREAIEPGEWRARVTYLHQVPVRLPGDVRENIQCVRALESQVRRTGSSAMPEAEVAGRAGVSLETPVQHLSGGEAGRLALYRAIASGPDVLLLDEPTAALDEDAARVAEQALLAWARAGGAVLWVAHDRQLAQRLGAREWSLR
ncbi:MAG: putative ABC transport system ATP-binding protein [Chlamydiales bacterium]|jgi:putative ABC transport system ATP-binding protein